VPREPHLSPGSGAMPDRAEPSFHDLDNQWFL
jgi:hypothetical protein